MHQEIINKIEISESSELWLIIRSPGNPDYQYIYREAAGIYWDNDIKGFKSTPRKSWTYLEWFNHIVSLVSSALSVSLILDKNIEWNNVPEDVKNEILSRQ